MAGIEASKTGLLDLENELTCSICTEVLHQPLTLLDCLHTFCGSCLKEWFALQATQAANAFRPGPRGPFTCPSCRATVRETRPDAKVTTLLDMFLQANPDKGKSVQEKEDIALKYLPGENVMPEIKRRPEGRHEAEERRLLEEARERSLREGLSPPASGRGTTSRSRSRETRDREREREERHRRRREEERIRRREENHRVEAHTAVEERPHNAELRPPGDGERHIEHQSSLRSLISPSDGENSMSADDILRQIIEGGLLHELNIEDLEGADEDEIAQRIADAYRQRHQSRGVATQETPSPPTASRNEDRPPSDSVRQSDRHHSRSHSGQHSHTEPRQHPPVSRPRLLESPEASYAHRRRSSDHNRRRTSPTPPTSRMSNDITRPAARSTTDLSHRPQSSDASQNQLRHISDARRISTEPEARISEIWKRGGTTGDMTAQSSAQMTDSPVAASPRTRRPPPIEPPNATMIVPPPQTTPRSRQLSHPPRLVARNSSPSSLGPRGRTALSPEPSISCDRCGKAHLEYDLHKSCTRCKDGNYNLCLRCYRLGRGCDHWFGFGSTAQRRFEQSAPQSLSSSKEPPHVLIGHKYLRPSDSSVHISGADRSRGTTIDDPSTRLQSGMFCDSCQAFANACFWRCDTCNEGEWGFCNDCVNQHKCCTHPLEPVAHASSIRSHILPSDSSPLPSPNPKLSGVLTQAEDNSTNLKDAYLPLTFSTNCDVCTYPITTSRTRFHCPTCNNGNLDICSPCYLSLISAGKITKENGNNGRRRCPSGHRMIIIGFEDHEFVQRRLVVRDLVGGHAIKDELAPTSAEGDWSWVESTEAAEENRKQTKHRSYASPPNISIATFSDESSKRFPPDGGVGMRCLARWSWVPEDGEDGKGELMFPKGAVVAEAEDINGDWFWGVYAGQKGIFPGRYVWVLESVVGAGAVGAAA